MADPNRRFRVKSGDVVHEEVDGELIAIDLSGGSYYSLSGSAPAVWSLLVGGAGEAEICAALAARYEAEPQAIVDQVAGLLEKLLASGLIVIDEERNGNGNGVAALPEPSGEKQPLQPAAFEGYTDMKDYFLLDPIHEVDPAAGWPRPAA